MTLKVGQIVGIVSGAVSLLVLIIILVCCCIKKRQQAEMMRAQQAQKGRAVANANDGTINNLEGGIDQGVPIYGQPPVYGYPYYAQPVYGYGQGTQPGGLGHGQEIEMEKKMALGK